MHTPQEQPWRRAAAASAVATGGLYALAQPPFSLWPLAFVCLVPLVRALAGRRLAARAALGALAGCAAGWASSLAPAAVGLAGYFDRSLAFGAAAGALAAAAFGGGAFALFAALAGDPARARPALLPWRIGVAFALAEWVRSHAATGLPWLLLAHALAPAPRLAQAASWLGSLGLGALLATSNGVAHGLLRRDARRAALAGGLAIAGALAAADCAAPRVAPGEAGAVERVASGAPPRAGALRIALIQPATPAAEARDPRRLRARLGALVSLSERALPADLVIWPENAFGAALPANEPLVRSAIAPLSSHAALLFGAPRYDPSDPTRAYNAMLLWDADGRLAGTHDKVHLLPFTEYVPAWLTALGLRGGATAPGRRLAPLALGETRLGVLTCYELLFGSIARSLVEDGAGVLVNPSNDAWFGTTAGSEQMLAAAVLRAIETHRPLLRVTPNGVTAAIDARGRVVARLPAGASGALVVDVMASPTGIEPVLPP